MCTIYTFTPSLRDEALLAARHDRRFNGDGASLIVVDGARVVLSIAGVWDTMVLNILRALPEKRWTRAFLHLRAATGGEVTTANCHGWGDRATGTKYVQHNGWINRRTDTAVDSQSIVEWIELGGTAEALSLLRDEAFANVFLIDEGTGVYYVHRSLTGSLYTDGNGNFGTTPFGSVQDAVGVCTISEYDLLTTENTWNDSWDAPVPAWQGHVIDQIGEMGVESAFARMTDEEWKAFCAGTKPLKTVA